MPLSDLLRYFPELNGFPEWGNNVPSSLTSDWVREFQRQFQEWEMSQERFQGEISVTRQDGTTVMTIPPGTYTTDEVRRVIPDEFERLQNLTITGSGPLEHMVVLDHLLEREPF
jgi:hypothetical protein